MREPCVMDLKMGTHSAAHDSSLIKQVTLAPALTLTLTLTLALTQTQT